MKNSLFLVLLILPVLINCVGSQHGGVPTNAQVEERRFYAPENGTYRIEDKSVQLDDGRAETEIVHGAASKTLTRLVSKPVYGDLDGNGRDDAVLLLVQQSGGSGTFFYLAAALSSGDLYQGTNSFLLGDRIMPKNIEIRNGQIIVLYNERRLNESMIVTPSVTKARYLRIVDGQLEEFFPTGKENRLVQGWVSIGHEVRAFLPCRERVQRWLSGDSPAFPEVKSAYYQAPQGSSVYSPRYMLLAGASISTPDEGFAADYVAGFRVQQMLESDPQGHCRNELIVVESPDPGEIIATSLKVTGRARGNWYFEGDFPLILSDAAGQVVAQGFATAQGPWMTREWVPFAGELEINGPYTKGWGWLYLQKDNPSSRAELDDAVVIPLLLE